MIGGAMSNATVTLFGNVAREPSLRTAKSGVIWTSIRIGSTHRYRDRAGEWREETTWFTVSVFGERAQNLVDSIRQGTPVVVTGRLAVREYERERELPAPNGQPMTVKWPGFDYVVENATVAIDLTRGTARYAPRLRAAATPQHEATT